MPSRNEVARLLDGLIGWHGAPASTRARLLQACCSGLRLRSLLSNGLTLILVFAFILFETRQPGHGVWLVTVILAGLLPRLYTRHLCRLGTFAHQTERRALTMVLINGFYGLVWGLGPFLILPHLEGPSVGILLFMMVFGTIMGPYASMPGLLYVRLATTGIPTLIAIGLYSSTQILLVCLIISAWLVLRTDVWRNYHLTLRQQFELQESLESRHAELESLNRNKEATNRLLQEMAETDPLTGAFNRFRLTSRLRILHGPAALIFFDIDHFKAINDDYGHPAGDTILKDLVALAQEDLRKEDLLARVGGEEFMIVLEGVDEETARGTAERIRERVEARDFSTCSGMLRITISLGVTVLPKGQPIKDAEELISKVDAALYEAKRKGRNKSHFAA